MTALTAESLRSVAEKISVDQPKVAGCMPIYKNPATQVRENEDVIFKSNLYYSKVEPLKKKPDVVHA